MYRLTEWNIEPQVDRVLPVQEVDGVKFPDPFLVKFTSPSRGPRPRVTIVSMRLGLDEESGRLAATHIEISVLSHAGPDAAGFAWRPVAVTPADQRHVAALSDGLVERAYRYWTLRDVHYTIERDADGVERINPFLSRLDRDGDPAAAARRMLRDRRDGLSIVSDDRDAAVRRLDGRQRRRWITESHLDEVAEVYQSDPKRPAKAIEHQFKVAPATASRWIRLARDHGKLPPRHNNEKD